MLNQNTLYPVSSGQYTVTTWQLSGENINSALIDENCNVMNRIKLAQDDI